jgi:hypothetical protein
MKKFFIIGISVISLLVSCDLFDEYIFSRQDKENETTKTSPSSVTVYITKTGSKYHTYNCSTIKNSTIHSISKSDAITQGYGRCEICKL